MKEIEVGIRFHYICLYICMRAKLLPLCLCATLWTVARHAPLSMGFSRQDYCSGLPCPPLGDLPDPGIKPMSLMSPSLAGRFFITGATWEAHICINKIFLNHMFVLPFQKNEWINEWMDEMEWREREEKKGSEVLPISLVSGEYIVISIVGKIAREAPGKIWQLYFSCLLSFVYLKKYWNCQMAVPIASIAAYFNIHLYFFICIYIYF